MNNVHPVFNLRVLGACSPELATSIIGILSKLLCFAVEAKKIAIHHRTPIFSPMIRIWLMNLSSLKRPSVHKSINKILPCGKREVSSIFDTIFLSNHGLSHWSRSLGRVILGTSSYINCYVR